MHNYLCLEQKMETTVSMNTHPPECCELFCSNRNKHWGGGFEKMGRKCDTWIMRETSAESSALEHMNLLCSSHSWWNILEYMLISPLSVPLSNTVIRQIDPERHVLITSSGEGLDLIYAVSTMAFLIIFSNQYFKKPCHKGHMETRNNW